MIRLLGVLFIFTASCFMGMQLSSMMKKKLERLISYRQMSDEIATLIRYRNLKIREIMIHLKESEMYSELDFLHNAEFDDKSRPVGEIWLENIRLDSKLSSDEKKLMSQLGMQLGTTDTEGQLSVLCVFNKSLNTMIEKQSEKYAVKGKLCRSMGILMGAAVGIMIL